MEINSRRRQNTKVAAPEILPIFTLNTQSNITMVTSYIYIDDVYVKLLIPPNFKRVWSLLIIITNGRMAITKDAQVPFHGYFMVTFGQGEWKIAKICIIKYFPSPRRKCKEFGQRMHLPKKNSWEGKVNVRIWRKYLAKMQKEILRGKMELLLRRLVIAHKCGAKVNIVHPCKSFSSVIRSMVM